jgi:hypothetical protein
MNMATLSEKQPACRKTELAEKRTWLDEWSPDRARRKKTPRKPKPDDNEDVIFPFGSIKATSTYSYLVNINKDRLVWFPKRNVTMDKVNCVICAPRWLMRDKGLKV